MNITIKELIRHAIVEDIMDKQIKNPKTGNKIKVRTALQLPGEHPANKMAKKLVAKTPTKDDDKKDTKKGKIKSDPFDSNVPKKEKPIDRKKLVGKQDDVAKSMGAEHTADILRRGTADKIQDFVDAIDDKGQDFKKIDKLTNSLRDNPDDMKTRQAIFKLLTLKESKKRRYTVKEVRMWMKKLEENRYKKVYNSDARRVSWLCNHIGENLENMPKSMRKKWTKAQYGRERYLAKEFLKSKNTENKLRESIQKILTRLI